MSKRLRATPTAVRQVTLVLLAVAIVAILLQVAAVIISYGTDQDYLDRAKTDQEVDAITDAIGFDDKGVLKVVLPHSMADRYAKYPGAYAFEVVDEHNNILAQTNTLPDAIESSLRGLRPDYFMTCLERDPDRVCVSSRRVIIEDHTYWVRVAVAGDPAGIVLGVFLREILDDVGVPIGAFLLAALLVNMVAVRRVLRPLGRAAEEARQLEPWHEHVRLSEEGMPKEVLTLVRAINEMLMRTDKALSAQREFTANAAHELRTPIAVLMLRLEGLSGEVADRLRADVKVMARLVDQLLEMALADSLVVDPKQQVDLAEVARESVEALAIYALDKSRELEFEDLGAPQVTGNADAIGFALRNLIENAVRYSPPGETVRVVVGPGPQLQVLDKGPGIPPAQRELVFGRFWRAQQVPGSAGLGLAIVRRLADAHGARIIIDDAPGGGARITIKFPQPVIALRATRDVPPRRASAAE